MQHERFSLQDGSRVASVDIAPAGRDAGRDAAPMVLARAIAALGVGLAIVALARIAGLGWATGTLSGWVGGNLAMLAFAALRQWPPARRAARP